MAARVERGWVNFIVDRVFGWWSGLPGESCSYTVEKVRIPIRVHEADGDGEGREISLAANLYQPTISKPRGTVLVRTSYGIGPLMALSHARLYAARGYQVLLAACRGTDASDGCQFVPAVNEAHDGLATVAWMRDQSWYSGSFGTLGGSYLGYTQWALLSDPPPDLRAAAISAGPSNFGGLAWGSGAMGAHLIAWADLMTAPKRGIAPGPAYIKTQADILQPVYDGVPLTKAIDKHFQSNAPDWLKLVATDSKLTDPLFKRMDQSAALDRVDIPILQITGWQDTMLSEVVHQHGALAKRGKQASITVGPWSHLGAQRQTIAESFAFLDEHLGGRAPKTPRLTPVRVYMTGAGEWRNYATWPPSRASTHELYLGPQQTLSSHQPSDDASESTSTFHFDPTNPTPNIGLPRAFDGVIPASYVDTALAERSDVVVFTSAPLEADLESCGQPLVELYHSSDNPNVDIMVRLSEVDAKGSSTRISDRYKRLDPARAEGPIKMELTPCAHRFRRGSRIRIIIAGSAHPAYIRNLGTGENQATGDSTKPACHVVRHSADFMSKISLPVIAT
ncbi:hypothetical protein QQS21_005791 [Conoideocrella luteorostrata]|uniref:Xaa-Pro dipeptidyl-peptidase C-terminal domain-containing protein n=1 Tax=Conoideocrella luteorostrata TaxID=1105319 RepID=A0AAJ0CT29_9HYPO|nr:hypothetical protein QQS21_005791 [Conoideocrella luteorostrata]